MNTTGPHGAANLLEYLLDRIQSYGDKVAQIDASTGERLTYQEIWQDVQRTGHWLRKEGVGRGSIVGICLENCLDFAPLLLGVLQAGATAALYPAVATQRELEHLISVTYPNIIFAPKANPEQKNAIMKFPGVRLLTYKRSELEAVSSSGDPVELCPADLDSYALFLFSSGSTGLPKAVVIKHTNLLWVLSTTSSMLMEEDKPALGLMPFYHAYGLGLMLMALTQGSLLIVMPKFNIEDFNSSLIKYKIHQIHIVSPLLIRILSDEVPSKALKYVRKVVTAATAISPKLQAEALVKLEAGAKIYHSYGMTESTHTFSIGEMRPDKPGSSGQIHPKMKGKIIDSNGLTLGPGEQGELCIQGPMLTCGYYKNIEATEEAFTPDRWLKTGDLAYMDADGYLYIQDRIKDIIKFQGFLVSVTELEMVIHELPGVEEVAVVGVKHEKYGEVPRALVVLENKSKITEEDIKEAVSKELSYYKWLRGGVRFVQSLPKTPSMKINRKLLKSMR